ncbi:hypothetical protein MKW92_020034, partial [Papaver armeniacum]
MAMKSALKEVRTHVRHRDIPGVPKAYEENIFVAVRMRPLSRREKEQNDQIAWQCTDEHTILYRNLKNERSTDSYTF